MKKCDWQKEFRKRFKKPIGNHPIEECTPACFDESKTIVVKPKKKSKGDSK